MTTTSGTMGSCWTNGDGNYRPHTIWTPLTWWPKVYWFHPTLMIPPWIHFLMLAKNICWIERKPRPSLMRSRKALQHGDRQRIYAKYPRTSKQGLPKDLRQHYNTKKPSAIPAKSLSLSNNLIRSGLRILEPVEIADPTKLKARKQFEPALRPFNKLKSLRNLSF